MDFIVSKIVDFMKCNGAISDDQEESDFYRYGVEITISSILNIILVMFIGVITKHIIESTIFLAIFIFIRSFTGGFHASTYFKCNALMCISFVCEIIAYELLKKYNLFLSTLILAMCSIAIIITYGPVENPNKPIPEDKKVSLKIKGALLSILFAIINVILLLYNIKIGFMIVLTLATISILIIAAKIKEGGKNYNEN